MSLGPQQEGRQGMSTLKRGAMPMVKRSAQVKADKIQEEEESKEVVDDVGKGLPQEDIIEPRKKP